MRYYVSRRVMKSYYFIDEVYYTPAQFLLECWRTVCIHFTCTYVMCYDTVMYIPLILHTGYEDGVKENVGMICTLYSLNIFFNPNQTL